MYKIGINQNEKINATKKPKIKHITKQLLKVITLLITITIIITMMMLVISGNSWNSKIKSNNDNNWSINDDTSWEAYYSQNCPTKEKYNLENYKNNLQNIILQFTDEKLKKFSLNYLLNFFDSTLQKNKVDIPNNFFTYLPINPAIDIKINGEDAIANNFLIKVPVEKKIQQLAIVISVSEIGNSYNLKPCQLKFNFKIENDWIKRSLSDIKKTLTSDKSLIQEIIFVTDDSNVKKTTIDDHIILVISQKIEKIGEKQWDQKFSDQDLCITTNAKDGENYQKAKKIKVTITGKNQLQGTIKLVILMQCYNSSPSEFSFKNNEFNAKNLDSINLLPSVFPYQLLMYTIDFKTGYNANSLISLLFGAAINDMNNFLTIDNINLAINLAIRIDDDNYQISCNEKVNHNVIKKINSISLISNCQQNGKYLHLNAIGLMIKYNVKQELIILDPFNVNIENNNLTFLNFSSIVKIKAWR